MYKPTYTLRLFCPRSLPIMLIQKPLTIASDQNIIKHRNNSREKKCNGLTTQAFKEVEAKRDPKVLPY